MKNLIGLSGKKRSGKDTSGKFLSEITGSRTYALAYPIKAICSEMFGLTQEDLDGETKEMVQTFKIKDWRENILYFSNKHFPEYRSPFSDDELCDLFYKTVLYPCLVSENEKSQTAIVKLSPRKIMQYFGTEFGRKMDGDLWIKLAHREFEAWGSLIVTDVRFDNEAQWIRDNNGVVVKVVNDRISSNSDSHVSERGVNREFISYTIENNGSLEELRNGMEVLADMLQDNVISLNDLV
jgi:hypothetical protein